MLRNFRKTISSLFSFVFSSPSSSPSKSNQNPPPGVGPLPGNVILAANCQSEKLQSHLIMMGCVGTGKMRVTIPHVRLAPSSKTQKHFYEIYFCHINTPTVLEVIEWINGGAVPKKVYLDGIDLVGACEGLGTLENVLMARYADYTVITIDASSSWIPDENVKREIHEVNPAPATSKEYEKSLTVVG